jgi:hypothetical protein
MGPLVATAPQRHRLTPIIIKNCQAIIIIHNQQAFTELIGQIIKPGINPKYNPYLIYRKCHCSEI